MPRKTKDTSEDVTVEKKVAPTKKQPTKKATTATKKVTTKKKTNTKAVAKKASTTKKKTTTKQVTSSTKKQVKKEITSLTEYYDLPYRYNQTMVKILAQTPTTLFVYWDISDEDRLNYETQYGTDFFENTVPILIVHNKTLHYDFELEINDFANSWYIQVSDSNCNYVIELARKPKQYISSPIKEYVYLISSNAISAPNDHILFEKFNPKVTYKNVQNHEVSVKDFNDITRFGSMKRIYHLYDLYKEIYQDELFDEITEPTIKNPSSSSSSFK